MNGYGKLYTLVICSGQLLASKIHSIFIVRNKIAEFFCNPHDSYLPPREKIALPYTSPELVHNLLNDQ